MHGMSKVPWRTTVAVAVAVATVAVVVVATVVVAAVVATAVAATVRMARAAAETVMAVAVPGPREATPAAIMVPTAATVVAPPAIMIMAATEARLVPRPPDMITAVIMVAWQNTVGRRVMTAQADTPGRPVTKPTT